MSKCDMCIHEKVCRRFEVLSGLRDRGEKCENFEDRALVRVLPCLPSDTVYVVESGAIIRAVVAQAIIESGLSSGVSFVCYGGVSFRADQWGVTAFSDRESALEAVHGNDGR